MQLYTGIFHSIISKVKFQVLTTPKGKKFAYNCMQLYVVDKKTILFYLLIVKI